MTPKEKAKQLIERFSPHARLIANETVGGQKHAIECSLICVEEILAEPSDEVYFTDDGRFSSNQYWQKVKEVLTATQQKTEPQA